MGSVLEEYKKRLNDDSLTDEEVVETFNGDKQSFDKEVNDKVNEYERLDMDAFIKRIGGYEKIEQMNKINEKLDRSELINGKLVEKTPRKVNEDIEEWKRGFMEGYDEAYRRLMNR